MLRGEGALRVEILEGGTGLVRHILAPVVQSSQVGIQEHWTIMFLNSWC